MEAELYFQHLYKLKRISFFNFYSGWEYLLDFFVAIQGPRLPGD